jgi:DNA mismatch repair ATPase MutS
MLITCYQLWYDMITCTALHVFLLMDEESILEYGISFVDTATGTFHVAYFKDDLQKTQLRSLLFRIRPTEVIYQKV